MIIDWFRVNPSMIVVLPLLIAIIVLLWNIDRYIDG
jgi:hypothetical protein